MAAGLAPPSAAIADFCSVPGEGIRESKAPSRFLARAVHVFGAWGLCRGMDEQQPQPYDDIAAAGAPATPDALRSIVARHQRARTRTLGIALAIALVAGPIAGWAVGHAGGGGQQVATGSSPDKSNAGAPSAPNAPAAGGSAGAFAYPGANPPKATHLFTRTTSDGITIRAYRIDPPTAPPTASTPPKAQQSICPKPM